MNKGRTLNYQMKGKNKSKCLFRDATGIKCEDNSKCSKCGWNPIVETKRKNQMSEANKKKVRKKRRSKKEAESNG